MLRFQHVAAAAVLLFSLSVFADEPMWPGADYDPAIPTIEDVVGHQSGERITWHHETVRPRFPLR